MNHIIKLMILGSFAIFIGSAAQAGNISAKEPDKVLAAMQEYGFASTLSTDSDGDPMISSKVSKSDFFVIFYGCEENKDCKSIMFRAGYDLTNPISALKVNEWNRDKRFGKAYIDDQGDPFLEFEVNMFADGVGEENFQDTLDWWRLVVEGFEEFIDW